MTRLAEPRPANAKMIATDGEGKVLFETAEIGRPLTKNEIARLNVFYITPGDQLHDPLSQNLGFGWKYTADVE